MWSKGSLNEKGLLICVLYWAKKKKKFGPDKISTRNTGLPTCSVYLYTSRGHPTLLVQKHTAVPGQGSCGAELQCQLLASEIVSL